MRRYRHSQWDAEHVLLALLELEPDLPSDILIELGAPTEDLKAKLRQALEAGAKVSYETNQIYPHTPRGPVAG